MSERDLLDRLNVRYARTGRNGTTVFRRYSRAEHVPVGLQHQRHRICDYIAIDMQSNGHTLPAGTRFQPGAPIYHGHEVKTSRSDWLRELADTSKAETFRQHMHYWWLVVPDTKIVRDDLPEGWGLLVAHGRSLRVVVPAILNPEPAPIPHTLTGALIRAVTRTEGALATSATAPVDAIQSLLYTIAGDRSTQRRPRPRVADPDDDRPYYRRRITHLTRGPGGEAWVTLDCSHTVLRPSGFQLQLPAQMVDCDECPLQSQA